MDYLLVAAELASPLEGRVADAVAPEATVARVVVLPVAALVAVLALQAALLADVQDVADLTSSRGGGGSRAPRTSRRWRARGEAAKENNKVLISKKQHMTTTLAQRKSVFRS